MKNLGLLISILFIAVLFCSCGKENNNINDDEDEVVATGLIVDQVINIDGIDRAYHLFIPNEYMDAPIVILFHGHTGSHDELLGLGGEKAPYKVWLEIAEREHIILAIPNGLFISQNEKGWNDCRADALTNSLVDDVQFISSLLDFIIETYQANANRIYVNGTSNGGHFCIRLANELPNKLTAFATIIASNAVNSECVTSSTPISALFMNGTSDPFLPYDGGQMASGRGEVLSTENTVSYWVDRNGTDTTPEVLGLADIDSNDNCSIEKFTYSNGINNTEVVLYKVIDGGHAEPSIEEVYSGFALAILGNQNGDIEMADEVWSFFKNKTK